MKKNIAVTVTGVAMIVAGLAMGGRIYWWESPAWALTAGCYACSWWVFARLRRVRRSCVAERGDWLHDSASWPWPWTHHDLDYMDDKLSG